MIQLELQTVSQSQSESGSSHATHTNLQSFDASTRSLLSTSYNTSVRMTYFAPEVTPLPYKNGVSNSWVTGEKESTYFMQQAPLCSPMRKDTDRSCARFHRPSSQNTLRRRWQEKCRTTSFEVAIEVYEKCEARVHHRI